MVLSIYLAINPMNELKNQNTLELVEELWKTIVPGHCVLFEFLDFFLQLLQSCNSDTGSSNSDQS